MTNESVHPPLTAGAHVRVQWAGLDAEGVIVDIYSSVVGARVVVDILWNGDSSTEEATRIAVPADRVTILSAA